MGEGAVLWIACFTHTARLMCWQTDAIFLCKHWSTGGGAGECERLAWTTFQLAYGVFHISLPSLAVRSNSKVVAVSSLAGSPAGEAPPQLHYITNMYMYELMSSVLAGQGCWQERQRFVPPLHALLTGVGTPQWHWFPAAGQGCWQEAQEGRG